MKNSQHLEKAARKLAESTRVNDHQCQSRYIILPSHKQHHQESHRQSPTTSTTSSSPLIDLLTNDDVFSDSCEETHILIPSPLLPLVRDESVTRSPCPPPRPRTRHPRLRAHDLIMFHSPDVVDEKAIKDTSFNSQSSSSSSSSSCTSPSEKANVSTTESASMSMSSVSTGGNGCVNKSPKDGLLPEQLVQSITSVTYSVKVS